MSFNNTLSAAVQSFEDSNRINVLDIKFVSVQEGVYNVQSCSVDKSFAKNYPALLDKARLLEDIFPIGTDETADSLYYKMINQVYQLYNNAWWFVIEGQTVVDNS